MAEFNIFDVQIENTTMEAALETIRGWLTGGARARTVYFANAHCLNVVRRNLQYREALEHSDVVFADGTGVAIAARLQGRRLLGNVNGTDLFPLLCALLEREKKSVYLLGGRQAVLDSLVEWMRNHYPDLRVAGARHGYFSDADVGRVVDGIRHVQADALLVGLGVPKQEIFLDAHLAELDVQIAFAVGGLFDYYSGRLPRAPSWLRRLGMEWVFRLSLEPRRLWRRYLVGNPVFLWHAALEAARQRRRTATPT